MRDSFEREIDYLRIAVTDRCNLRCTYCMPPEGVTPKNHEEILSIEEIIRSVGVFSTAGIRKIRLTGGEPLVRKNITGLIRGLKGIAGIEEISLTTNGILLGPMARDLKEAGLDRVNISLDTLDPERFREITRLGDLSLVLEGIDRALEMGLTPLKVNAVAIRGFNDGEIGDFLKLAVEKSLEVRFIELMPVGQGDSVGEEHIPVEEILAEAQKHYELVPEEKGRGPARVYRVQGTGARLGLIGALTSHFCDSCNRMRLTADGKLRPCLYSSREYDLRSVLRGGGDDGAVLDLYSLAIGKKPEKHNMQSGAWEEEDRYMSQIGG